MMTTTWFARSTPERTALRRLRRALRDVARVGDWPAAESSTDERGTPVDARIAALMLELTAPGRCDRVLEIGTGNGYRTAVLAELAGEVYSVDLREHRAVAARERLRALGYRNVEVAVGDGVAGWPSAAPFDAIVVGAAATAGIPRALRDELAVGGRLVIPIGEPPLQELVLLRRTLGGRFEERSVLPLEATSALAVARTGARVAAAA